MMLEVPVEDGAVVEFECADTWVSRWVCQTILEDKTYPHLPFIDDVQVVFDVVDVPVHVGMRAPPRSPSPR